MLHDIGHTRFRTRSRRRDSSPTRPRRGAAAARRAVRAPHRAGRHLPRDGDRRADPGAKRPSLQGLISGSLDLDKIDYLCRDSRMCGVPYGVVDVDRLLPRSAWSRPATEAAKSVFRKRA
jgi:HD superfamily phosphohydrolase